MAVHFDHRLNTDDAGINIDIGWLKNSPILAVLSYSEDRGGTVSLFNEEGEKLQHKPIAHSSHPSSYAWHPTRKIIAVGWETGEITLWNEQDKELIEAAHLHRSEVTVMRWSSSGSRLLSADNSGVIIGWKSDSKGRLGQDPYQHHIQEPVTKIISKPAPPPDPGMDISSLARAAVSGDESALDMFNWKRGGKNKIASSPFGPQESLSFFVGGASGGVYFMSESGRCIQCFSVDTPIKELLFYEEKNVLVTITENLMLTQHAVFGEGDTKEILKVKMSGRSDKPMFIWAGKGVLATATGESMVRMWDLDQDDNYILTLEGHSGYDSGNEAIMCLAYNSGTGVLAGGTNMGNVALWKYTPPAAGRKIDGDEKWRLQAPATVEGPVRQIEWSHSKGFMAVNTIANVYVLCEQVMIYSYKDQTAVVQYGPGALSLEIFSAGTHHDVKTEIQVKGICTTKDALAVWNGKRVIVYDFAPDKSMVKAAGTFATEAMIIALYEQNVYTIEQNKVQVRTFQGTVKQLMTFAEPEGHPVSLDVCGTYLVVATDVGIIRVYDLSRREAKPHSNPKNLADVIPGFGAVVSAKVNCAGNRVSIQAVTSEGKPDHRMYFWDVELDTVQYFNFETGRGEQDDYPAPGGTQEAADDEDTNDAERGKTQAAKDIAGRYPVSQHWDPAEPKLFVCEAWNLIRSTADLSQNYKPSLTKIVDEGPVEVMVISLFCTPENGILIQDSFPLPPSLSSLMGVEVPYYIFTKKSESNVEELEQHSGPGITSGSSLQPKLVARKIMRDFVGLESSDKGTRDAMMNFSFYLAVGNMDEAFKAIKLIKSESVWENMAKMCVKSRRLDVASVCLGNMGHARGAKALREAAKEPELDARVAVLAMQLGLYEDAERLLRNCKRYDLLNEFYQNQGQWQKALETAEMYDRIHLRTTFYSYARHLEEQGDPLAAIPNYEKSETHKFEVPRMLADDPEQLEEYVSRTTDKTLHRWWAQYMESTGDMETAIQFYETAQDFFSLVRVYCYCSNMEKASSICNETGDKAACYYLARQYENQDQIKEAIHFFQRAQAYGSAIRLCKEHGFEDQLLNSALMGRPEDMMEAARHYETKQGFQDKAVMLYHKAGNYSKALDLAFTTKQFGALQLISSDLDERADPELLQRCADFFLENGQFDKAVDLLAIGKKFWEAVKICMDQTVEITEDLSEKLTPDKDFDPDPMARLKILEAIAEVCMHQGAYHLATKKFTQAGNKIKAMKALLKSGDTEKIMFFAGVSRQREIYVMAANYLQSLDWRKDPEVMKNIIAFYTKGRALDALASFYDACAQVEIDEYQNYDKALGALGEAYKCMSKAKMDDSMLQEERLGAIKHKMALIKRFVMARRSYQENSEEAIKQCQVLLEEQDLDSAVRIGDIYGFMIEHYASKDRWKAAHAHLEELQSRMPGIHLGYYVNSKTIEAIFQALALPMDRSYGTKSQDRGFTGGFRVGGGDGEGDEEHGEFIEEEVIEDNV
ncbi:intraflagellar transport protein 140 homolog [Elysia marginata]|uniref:Intraflagellar transport protein 140 homolog n=1 Tax=Elysia marginata TaxID=1093978 RepID=A0AAV4HYL1_9GAST|nr:intraflagellar transport protein 140 homolog [Elysia marginata]